MGEKENRKIRYTKMVIRDSLMELMKSKPIPSVSIKAICELADINRSTFYSHYKDQYDLLRQVEEETLSYFENMLDRYKDKHSKTETTQMLEEMLAYIAKICWTDIKTSTAKRKLHRCLKKCLPISPIITIPFRYC